ncbi:SpoIID/LytB domain-containing protein [Luteimicrobium sp. NPDC057192]|uniref:SpoIID/LytB domain-containing protein n=1 Tax=Luteimicrobium sp. NPDC057192 TaxID=3346042 RepID=UPI00363A5049
MGTMGRIRNVAVTMGLAAGLTLGLAGLAAPAQAATTTVTLTGPSSAYQGVSTKLTVTWKVGGKGHAGTVAVQQRVNGIWYALGSTKTSSAGTGTISVKPRATAVFRARTSSGVYSAAKTLTIKAPYVISAKAASSTITKGRSTTLAVTYTYRGARVSSATARLQKKSGSTWATTAKTAKITNGSGSVVVKPTSTALYRLVVSGKATSAAVKVTVRTTAATVPSSFTAKGSGFGHGVGMPQYGAYQLARLGHSSTTILKKYYTGAAPAVVTTPTSIAVQIWGPEPYGYPAGSYSDTATSTTVHIDSGTWRLRSSKDTTLYEGKAPVTVTIGVSGTKVTATFKVASGTTTVTKKYTDSLLRVHWSGTTYYKPTSTKAVATVKGAQGTYRNGRFTITAIGGHPNVVNDLRLNTEYLYGIAEMPSSWGTGEGVHALAAQAIVARSYAITKLASKNAKCACNVVDDVRDQNFTGWKKQNEGTSGYYGKLWVAAVNKTLTSTTRAKALLYGGKVVATHYYSSSGGRTASSQDVWVAKVPYEQSVADPWSLDAPGNSYRSWTRSVSQSTAKRIFGLTDVKAISVSAKYSSGQMKTLTATSSTGKKASITGKADTLRAKFGFPAAWVSSFTAK